MIGVTGGNGEDGCTVMRECCRKVPADKAGIESGDIITRLAGFDVPSFEGLRNLVARQRIGSHVPVCGGVGSKHAHLDVRIGRR